MGSRDVLDCHTPLQILRNIILHRSCLNCGFEEILRLSASFDLIGGYFRQFLHFIGFSARWVDIQAGNVFAVGLFSLACKTGADLAAEPFESGEFDARGFGCWAIQIVRVLGGH